MTARKSRGLSWPGFLVAAILVADGPGPRAAPSPPTRLITPEPGYLLTPILRLTDPLPKGGQIVNDFEAWAINSTGALAFAVDVSTGGEGVLLLDAQGTLKELARSGDPAPPPATGQLGDGVGSVVSLNDAGDASVCFTLPGNTSLCATYLFPALGLPRGLVLPGDPVGNDTIIGCTWHASMNRSGKIAVAALVDGGFTPDVRPGDGSGVGIILREVNGQVSWVVRPGDPAPGGVFANIWNPWINDQGDIGFGAQLLGELCIDNGKYLCNENGIYLRRANGEILRLAHQGDPAPGGGTYRIAWGAELNERAEVAFIGDLTADPDPTMTNRANGVFLFTEGKVVPVGRPADLLPGGGRLVKTTYYVGGYSVNNRGEVTFGATLDTLQKRNRIGMPPDDVPEQGLYVWAKGNVRLVARTGTLVPGGGKLLALLPPESFASALGGQPADFPSTYLGGATNDRGQVVLTATVEDATGALQGLLLTATPVAPYYFLSRRRDDSNRFEAALSTAAPITELSFSLTLDGECASKTIDSVDPGSDLLGKLESWQVNRLDGNRTATVVAKLAAGSPLGAGENQRVVAARLAGQVGPGSNCRFCFAEAGDPAVAPSIVAADGARSVPCGECLEILPPPTFRRGDADASGKIELTDAVRLLNYLFLGQSKPECLDAADLNDDGKADVSDAVWNLSYQFLSGPPPLDPGPTSCGPDVILEDPDLGCDQPCP